MQFKTGLLALALCTAGPALAAEPPAGAGCLSDATRAASVAGRAPEAQRPVIAQLLTTATEAAKAGDGAACRRAANDALAAAGLPPLAPILLSTSIAGESRATQAVPAPPRSGAVAGSTPAAPPPPASQPTAPQGPPRQQAANNPGAGPAAVQQANASPGDAAHGQSVAKVCTACHSIDASRAIRVGPPLYAVENRRIASVQGFGYSAALKAKDGAWDDATLNAFLKNPRGWAPGTRMAYPGIANDRDRADVVAYLATLK